MSAPSTGSGRQSGEARGCAGIIEGQAGHAAALVILLFGASWMLRGDSSSAGSWLGVSTTTLAWASIAFAVAHQVYVWILWRAELHRQWLTTRLRSRAFAVFGTGFALLGFARTAGVFAVAAANAGAWSGGDAIRRGAALAALVLSTVTFISVARWFGFRRAMGEDHFDDRVRARPMVRQGAFRLTSNAMYTMGFLLLWVPGLWVGSPAALVVAGFNHLYVWVHYFCTERPDMRRMYGGTG